MIKGQTVKRLAAFLLAVCLLLGAVPAVSDVERDEEGGTWDWDSGIYTDPTGKTHPITQGGVSEDSGSSSSSQSSGGAMVIDTGEADPLAGMQQNSDGSITVESGQGGVDIEIQPTRAPLTQEEWEALNNKADLRNGTYTATVYKDPATGAMLPVTVKYMGIGRSMVELNDAEVLVNTVDLSWQTEAPADKVMAVVKVPHANLRSRASAKSTKSAILRQVQQEQVVRVITVEKGWALVDHNGKRGYIKTSSLEFFANDHTDFTYGVVSVKGKTKGCLLYGIRSRDKTHRNLMDESGVVKYALGTPVTVFDIVDEWAEVDICGWHCFMLSKFLTVEKESASAD